MTHQSLHTMIVKLATSMIREIMKREATLQSPGQTTVQSVLKSSVSTPIKDFSLEENEREKERVVC